MLPALVVLAALFEEPSLRVAILPLGTVESRQIQAVKDGLNRQFHLGIVTLKSRPLPAFAHYKPRNRYRADLLLDYLDRNALGYDKVIAVTQRDISSTHRGHYDWGIVGLGRLGGYSCVVSTFRLRKKGALTPLERLRRTTTHEIGHTFGLDHCLTPTCVMRDAGGRLKTIDEAGPNLCPKCVELSALKRRRCPQLELPDFQILCYYDGGLASILPLNQKGEL